MSRQYFFHVPYPAGVRGFRTRLHLFTFPEQIFYGASARKIVQGVDGIIFVAGTAVSDGLVDSVVRLKQLLSAHSYVLERLPLVALGYHQDAGEGFDAPRLKGLLGSASVPVFEASRTRPQGVLDGLKHVTKLIFLDLTKTANDETPAATNQGLPQVTGKHTPYGVHARTIRPWPPTPRRPFLFPLSIVTLATLAGLAYLWATTGPMSGEFDIEGTILSVVFYLSVLAGAFTFSLWLHHRNRREEEKRDAYRLSIR